MDNPSLEGLEAEVVDDDVRALIQIKAAQAVERRQAEARRASADSEIQDAAAKLEALMRNPKVSSADLDRELKRALAATRSRR